MQSLRALIVLLALAIPLAFAAEGKPATVKGYVLDSACAFTKGLEKPISRDCAKACAKGGSPLVILTSDVCRANRHGQGKTFRTWWFPRARDRKHCGRGRQLIWK